MTDLEYDDRRPRPEPDETARREWIDQLVELHVLAEHGDDAAATTAQQWIATDADARRIWDDVERVRDQLLHADQHNTQDDPRSG
jgi:hypothetical protein